MAKNSWHVVTKDGAHTVVAEHGYFSGRIKVFVDGVLALKKSKQHSPWNLSSLHPFKIGADDAALYIVSPDMIRYKYDLFVNGESVTTGEALPEQVKAEAARHVPVWGWLFVIATFITYVVGVIGAAWLLDSPPSRNNIIWHIVGMGAVGLCVRVVSDTLSPAKARMVRASAVVIGTLLASAALTSGLIYITKSYWHTVSSAQGGYSVMVPCDLKEEPGDPTSMVCQDRNMEYAIWYSYLTADPGNQSPSALLQSVVDSMRQPSPGETIEITGEKAVTLDTYPGLAFVARRQDERGYLRAYLVEKRLVHMSVTAKTNYLNEQRATKFLDSLQVDGPAD